MCFKRITCNRNVCILDTFIVVVGIICIKIPEEITTEGDPVLYCEILMFEDLTSLKSRKVLPFEYPTVLNLRLVQGDGPITRPKVRRDIPTVVGEREGDLS